MAAITKVVINSYVSSIIGESGISVPDSTIIAGMEDFVRKLELLRPDSLKEMEDSIAIAASPVTLQYPYPGISVYCGNDKLVEKTDVEHVGNPYSYLDDYGNTGYFYLIGNLLYVYPFSTLKTYTYRGIVYSVQNGTLVWPDRFVYPLALVCAYTELFGRFSSEVKQISLDGSAFGVNLNYQDGTVSPLNYGDVDVRLNDDDVELAGAELEKIKTQISAFGAVSNAQQIIAYKLNARVENAKLLLGRAQAIYQQYLSYFGIAQEGK